MINRYFVMRNIDQCKNWVLEISDFYIGYDEITADEAIIMKLTKPNTPIFTSVQLREFHNDCQFKSTASKDFPYD